MKKLLLVLLGSLLLPSVFANNCPSSNLLFKKTRQGTWVLYPPTGWHAVKDDRGSQYKRASTFRVAAWGDHYRDTDVVRCHYYNGIANDHVEVHSNKTFPESSFNRWHPNNHYAMCSSQHNNPNDCRFQ